MKADPMTLTRSAIGLGVAFLLAHGAPANAQGPAPQEKVAEAKPGDVRVMSTAAVRTPLEAVRAEAQKAIGHPIVIQFGSARGNIRSEILAGQAFEIAIPPEPLSSFSRVLGRSGSPHGVRGAVAAFWPDSGVSPKQTTINTPRRT